MSSKEQAPTDAFWSPDELEKANELVVRRSDLEMWMVCPTMGRLSQRDNWQGNQLTEVGESVHRCLSEALKFYISDPSVDATHLRHELNMMLRDTRPDVQPEVLKAAKRIVWQWTGYITKLPRGSIMAFDGGESVPSYDDGSRNRSGQLSWKIDHLNVVVTSEVDLLHATQSPEVLCEVDYKSGWKRWDYLEVSTAFQFNLHAWLVFQNYPDVEYLDVRIWNARANELAPRMRFARSAFDEINARITHAASIYRQWHGQESVPAWPDEDKCGLCPVAADCPRALDALRGSDVDPEKALKTLVALKACVSQTTDRLWQVVKATGEDVIAEDGTAFGYEKPVQRRKNPNPVYKIKGKQDA